MNAKDYFDNVAETWDKKFQTPRLLSFLAELVPKFNLKPGQKVLDVGTGTGVLIPYLARAVGPSGSVTALDLSKKMLHKCKTKYGQIKNINIIVGNIDDAAIPEESLNAVICFGVFPHLENKNKALHNINRMLKSGGKIIIAHALSSKELEDHHKRVSHHVAQAVIPTTNEMVLLLQQAGFIEIDIKDEPGCYLCIAHKTDKT